MDLKVHKGPLRGTPYKETPKRFFQKRGFPLRFTRCPNIHSKIRIGIPAFLSDSAWQITFISMEKVQRVVPKCYLKKLSYISLHELTLGSGDYIEL